MTGLARLTALSTTTVLERFTDAPPDGLPDGAIDVTWMADPCWHALTLTEAWDIAVDAGWGELSHLVDGVRHGR